MRRTLEELRRQAIEDILDREYADQVAMQARISIKTRVTHRIPIPIAVMLQHYSVGPKWRARSLEEKVDERLTQLLDQQKKREGKYHYACVNDITRGTIFEGVTSDWQVWDPYPPSAAELAEQWAPTVKLGFTPLSSVPLSVRESPEWAALMGETASPGDSMGALQAPAGFQSPPVAAEAKADAPIEEK